MVRTAEQLRERTGSSIFVGRERELEMLRVSLEEALTGRGQLALLVGEPGIGKTRTAYELAAYARLRGAQVLIGHCYEGEGAPPFWPWVQLIRSYVRECEPQTLIAELGAGAAAIAQVISEVKTQLPGLPTPPVLEPEQARFRFFDSVTTFFKNATKGRCLVLIVDDLHWADLPSLLLLRFLARELWESRLLIIGTYRDEVDRLHPLVETLADLARVQGSQRIPLGGLAERDIARFIELSAGLVPPAGLIAAVYKGTEGNPFFVSEVVRLLVSDGRLQPSEQRSTWTVTLPQSVRDVIRRRLRILSEEGNRILRFASVIGRDFNLEVLAGMSDASRDQLVEILEEAITARIITEGSQSGRYSFSHVLIREALYEELSAPRRIRLHLRAGEVIESLYRAHLDPYVAELAYHFHEAVSAGCARKAITYAVSAGEQATTLLAYEEAVSHYQSAVHVFVQEKPGDETLHCQLLLALGEAQLRAGDTVQARSSFLEAAAIAKQLHASVLLARAALGFEWVGVRAGIVDQQLVHLLEDALRALGENDSALRARVMARLARELYFSAASAERRDTLSQQAVAVARRVADSDALMAALQSRHLVLSREDVEGRLAIATEMIQLAEQADKKGWTLQGHEWRLTDLLELGDIQAVDMEIQIFAHLAEGLRQPVYLYFLTVFRVMRALLDGRLDEGESLTQQALAIGQRVDSHTAAQYFGVQIFRLRREQGRLSELEDIVKGLVAQYPAVPAWRCGLASLYRELEREAEARLEFEILAVSDFADLPRDNTWLTGVTLLAEVCAFLGDARRGATLYQLLLPYAGRNVVIGQAAACDGSISRQLGLLAATLARWEEAVQHFEDALKRHVQMRARPLAARTCYEYASMLLSRGQRGDRERGLELLDQALLTARALGMRGLQEKIQATKAGSRLPVHADLEAGGPRDRFPPTLSISTVRREVARASAGNAQLHAREPLPAQAQPAGPNVFRLQGEYWTLAYQGTVCRLKDAKGFHYLAFLLRHPGKEFHAIELSAVLDKSQTPVSAPLESTFSDEQLSEHRLRVGDLGDAGTLLDPQAKSAYRRHLAELRNELAEAQRFHDSARAAKAQAEIDFLTEELAAAVGLGGRDRPSLSASERARLNVTKAIKAALRKIHKNHFPLGQHLAPSVRTGIFCSYSPDLTHPVSWTL